MIIGPLRRHSITDTPISIILWGRKKINEPIGIISILSGTIIVPLGKRMRMSLF